MAVELINEITYLNFRASNFNLIVTRNQYAEEDGERYGAILRTEEVLEPFDGTLDTYGDLALYDYSSEAQIIQDVLDGVWTYDNLGSVAEDMGGEYSNLALSKLVVGETADAEKVEHLEVTGETHDIFFFMEFRSPLVEADITGDDFQLQWSADNSNWNTQAESSTPSRSVANLNEVLTGGISQSLSNVDDTRYFRWRITKDSETYVTNVVQLTRVSV